MTDTTRRAPACVLALAALWVTPLWIVRYPPMIDYPQQLALAAVLRWYGDPGRRFAETYVPALWAPHGLFELLTAGLAWVLPIEVAGKLIVSLALAAVAAAALALGRRTGQPAVYALLALALTFNGAFYWGFVDNLLAYPLVLGGFALADRAFGQERFGARAWLGLAGFSLLFYAVHLQFLLLFAGGVVGLALARRPGWRRFALQVSGLLPALALGLGVLAWASLSAPEGVIGGYERRMRALPTVLQAPPEKLLQLPGLLFGRPQNGGELAVGLLFLACGGLAVAFRQRTPAGGARRFAVLALGLGVLYLIAPQFHGGFLIADRIAPLAAMVGVAALPRVAPQRRRLVQGLAAAVFVAQLGLTLSCFLRFRQESAGLDRLLATTAPGKNLAGLIFERSTESWRRLPVYLHFPAYYQVSRGGRILFSFAELFQTPARFRPGKSWDALLTEVTEWKPGRFSYARHGARFQYFLVRGGPEDVARAFGPGPRALNVRSAGRWHLLERGKPLETPPARREPGRRRSASCRDGSGSLRRCPTGPS